MSINFNMVPPENPLYRVLQNNAFQKWWNDTTNKAFSEPAKQDAINISNYLFGKGRANNKVTRSLVYALANYVGIQKSRNLAQNMKPYAYMDWMRHNKGTNPLSTDNTKSPIEYNKELFTRTYSPVFNALAKQNYDR